MKGDACLEGQKRSDHPQLYPYLLTLKPCLVPSVLDVAAGAMIDAFVPRSLVQRKFHRRPRKLYPIGPIG